MKFALSSGSPEKSRTGCLLLGVFEGRVLSAAARQVDAASRGLLEATLRRGDMEGRAGQTLTLHQVPGVLAERVMLVGFGPETALGERRYRRTLADAMARLRETGATDACSFLTEVCPAGRDLHWCVRQAVEVASESAYRCDGLKSKKGPTRTPLRQLALAVPGRREQAQAEQALAQGRAIAGGVNLAKDLANLPPNICTPTYLAQRARGLARAHRSIRVKVLGPREMATLGMGALLAVARGSHQPPQLIVMEYWGAGDRKARPVALVGKGVTFDSGGISLKPAEAMDEMKFDMCGAASVFGAVSAVAELKLPLNLVALVPATENLPGGNATKPGDIVTTLSGQTVEILNTDAEGRLILCDAMTYARRYKPATMVDVATLTGACVVALGRHATGLFSNQAGLAEELLEAGRRSLDPAWQMPLWDDYQQQLDSNFADMANIGGREAGAVTAACFLSRFVEGIAWAHLDIAGTAYRGGKEKGATGRPVPMLVQFLLDRCGRGAG